MLNVNSLFWPLFFIFSRSYTEDFDILHGDLQGLSDTMTFLKSLAELDAVYDSGKNKEKHCIRERMAAAGIFNWEVLFAILLKLTLFSVGFFPH